MNLNWSITMHYGAEFPTIHWIEKNTLQWSQHFPHFDRFYILCKFAPMSVKCMQFTLVYSSDKHTHRHKIVVLSGPKQISDQLPHSGWWW